MSSQLFERRLKTPHPTNRGVSSPSSVKILSFGVDWLTATTRSDAVKGSWYEWFGRVTKDQIDTHGPGQQRQRLGYQGWLLADNTFLGYREQAQECLWISTGASAARDWQVIAGPARNISRIDLQVTCQLRRPRYQNIARDIYINRDLSKLQHTYYTSDTGSTCYVGSKSSDWFGRVYDKSTSYDALPGSVWRYEVCSKGKKINSQLVSQMQDACTGCLLHEFVTSFVWYWFQQRSCSPAFTAASPIALVTETGANLTYPDRQLAWLRAGVAPVISRLVRDGFGDRAMTALGLVQDDIPAWSDVEPEVGEKVPRGEL
jgi:hypothetical protein